MPGLLIPLEKFSTSDLLVSIVIQHVSDNQYHCGIIYKSEEDEERILHLAWNFKLRNTLISENQYGKYYFVNHNINMIRQMDMAAWLENIYRENINKIHYGLYYKHTYFEHKGIIRLGENECGLTCATFVLAVFKSAGLELIDLDNWPVRPDDLNWQDSLINSIELLEPEDKDYIKKLHKEKGCPRYKPQEVTASITFDNRPEHFLKIWKKGEIIKKELFIKNFLKIIGNLLEILSLINR